MKTTGIVRRVDDLGRVVIPIELRRTLGIGEKDSLEIFVEEDSIIFRKYRRNEDKAHQIAQLANVLEYTDNPHAKELIVDAINYIKKA